MKVAPIYRQLQHDPNFEAVLVHTGQHYDHQMSKVFFDDLRLPRPDVHLGVGSGSHAVQTAQVMIGFEKVLLDCHPDWVIVVGDVNSTVACAIDAAKLNIPVAHVEAGLRSEEINRILTDSISDLLLTPSSDADENLRHEGIPEERIVRVGNVMIDSLRLYESDAEASDILERLGVRSKGYGLVTMHRASNVDDPQHLHLLLDALEAVQRQLPLVFPIHPRSRKSIAEHGFLARISEMRNLHLIDPVGYLDFLKLQKHAVLVLTDSGGIQEETTVLGVPCLTLRENTERPITVQQGTNILLGLDPKMIVFEAERVLRGDAKVGTIPELWDGHTAERIVAALRMRAEQVVPSLAVSQQA
jgi:UDP-N-acetylglucosamine 2-epimerase (non-hydrolysing)